MKSFKEEVYYLVPESILNKVLETAAPFIINSRLYASDNTDAKQKVWYAKEAMKAWEDLLELPFYDFVEEYLFDNSEIAEEMIRYINHQ